MEWAASLNWCLFSHVHHIRPCSLEITHQSLVKISSPAVSTWSSDRRGLGRRCLLKKEKEREEWEEMGGGREKWQIGGSWLCCLQNTALFIRPVETDTSDV